jgi:pimeloyl-ACP methyl ester carboxylesterase
MVISDKQAGGLSTFQLPKVILAHGAFANAGCWWKLVPLLRAKGLAPTAAHCSLSSLAAAVAAVHRTINIQNGNVVLVGHSWGGAVITEAGNHPKVRGLVYIAAAAPDTGESFSQWWANYPVAPGAPEIKAYGDDRIALTLEGFRKHFAQDLAQDEIEFMCCLRGPFAPTSNEQPIANAAWRDKPSWLICGENDHMLLISLERDTARRLGARTTVLQSSHVPMLSHPGDVAEIIAGAAIELAGGPVQNAIPTEKTPVSHGQAGS